MQYIHSSKIVLTSLNFLKHLKTHRGTIKVLMELIKDVPNYLGSLYTLPN